MNPVTLTPEQAKAAMNTLVFADAVLLNMATDNRSVASLREELLELRRSISRQYNAPASPYVEQFCAVCGGTDRVLPQWERDGVTHERLCIECRRAIVRHGAPA